MAYETPTVGDWYNALVRTPADGVKVASVSLGAILNGVGDGTACPPSFAAPCGTIAEAAVGCDDNCPLVANPHPGRLQRRRHRRRLLGRRDRLWTPDSRS